MKSVILVMVLCITQAAVSKVAFQKQTDSQRLIIVANDDGSGQEVISNPKLDTYHPEISNDGRYVAYSRGTIRQGQEVSVEIVVKNIETGIVEVWTPKGNQYIHAEFSGNDQFLVYSGYNERNGKQNIHVIDLEKERQEANFKVAIINGELTYIYDVIPEVIESTYDCYAPTLASDASFIIYHRTLDKTNKRAPKQLMMYNRGSQRFTELTNKNKHAMFPSLSMDERYVAYVSKDGGQWDIYLYDLWKKSTIAVTEDTNMEFTPVFAADNTLYYTRFTPSSDGEDQIDVYYIPKEQVLDSSKKAEPRPYLNDPNAAEYVPSFSNPNELKSNILPDLLSPERSSFGAVFHNEKIYIAGGHQGPEHTYPEESFLRQVEVYDLKTKTWQSLAPMNTPKHGFQMVAYKEYLYVFGGFAYSANHLPAWKSLDTIERYNIRTNTWEVLDQKLPRRRSSNAIAKVDNKVYLLGGWDSTPKFENDKDGLFLKEVDVFDLQKEKVFVSSTRMPHPLRRALSAVVVKDEIYLMGGIGEGVSHFDWIDNVTALKPKNNTWRELPPLPFATFAPGVGEIKGDLYLIGGMILKNKATYDLNYVDDIYKFDQEKQNWSHTGVFLNQNKGFPQVVPMPKNSLGILGGHTYEFTPDGVRDHPVKSFEVISL